MTDNTARRVEFEGRRRIRAPLDTVWRELNNPEALVFCIRQCESLDRLADDRYRAIFRVGIGPLKVPVTAQLLVFPDDPPRCYRLRSEVALRLLGSAAGEAAVTLSADDDAGDVVLDYRAAVDLGGRLAGHGRELVDAAVARNMRRFFDRFDQWIEGR